MSTELFCQCSNADRYLSYTFRCSRVNEERRSDDFAKDKPICLLESSVSYFFFIFECSCSTELFCQCSNVDRYLSYTFRCSRVNEKRRSDDFAKDKPICLLESSVSYFFLYFLIFLSVRVYRAILSV